MAGMEFPAFFFPARISASAMAAQRARLEVTAANIANAQATRTSEGGPYRRRDVVFAAVLDDASTRAGMRLPAVEVEEIVEDPRPFRRVYNPGHPDADAQGYVLMPNVDIPMEMINLVSASRSYEANVKVLRAFRQMVEEALQIARG